MKERLVADWLTKAGERGGLDVSFCQILVFKGYRIIRSRHSPTENGKDIVAKTPSEKLCAYQVKSGDIGLRELEEIQPQLTALVESAILHPSIPRGSSHHSFLVTTGSFSEPVENRVQALNDDWRRRGFKPLTLIRGVELIPDMVKLSAGFWPDEPIQARDFLTLYLAEGIGDFDRPAFAQFLRDLLPDKGASNTVIARRIAAAGLFASYLLEPFHRTGDHWSAFCGWTITAAHQAWAAEKYKLPQKIWQASFDLTRAAALRSLENLATEALTPEALLPRGPELDDYTRLRNTIAASSIAAWDLIQRRNGVENRAADHSIKVVHKLIHDNRIVFWGESALPNLLSIFWLLEHSGQNWIGENLLLGIVGLITRHNHKFSSVPLKGPEVLPDEVVSTNLQNMRNPSPSRGRRAPVSWSLEALLHLLANRMRRQSLKALWYDITQVDMASFRPTRKSDLLLWRSDAGEEIVRSPGKPQSWAALTAAARKLDLAGLPEILTRDKDFALMFILAYPHRATCELIKALDKWIG